MTLHDKNSPREKKIIVNLSGPNGNAFVLIGLASQLGRQFEYSAEQIRDVQKEMMSGDYENLLQVFDRHFGAVVDLYR